MTITVDTPIPELSLTTQAPKSLADAGITTVGQLLKHGGARSPPCAAWATRA